MPKSDFKLPMIPDFSLEKPLEGMPQLPGYPGQAFEYWLDACQRSVLLWDVLRKRGNEYHEHKERGKPPLLKFDYEIVIDARTLEHPCNYLLMRIVPEPGMEADPENRPFIIVDPRAGHGPGIGGFKADSQVGIALKNRHPCYFVSFLPEPVPGQTISDIGRAEAVFFQKVMDLHPNTEGKPLIIGNCQAGWAVTLLSSVAPELVGPILLNGAPLSYWAGVEGKNPMRYLGGLCGGSWMASLAGDTGNGVFDGAHLVHNFENLNPANTYWSKLYNLYSKVDTEEERYLEFEKWWGGLFRMNTEELTFIVNQLFVGNKLSSGGIVLDEGRRIDIRNIKSPIIVFCSEGDNITPPAQALHWIVELYDSEQEIREREQTIIYSLHEDIGHLGIFVSGKVAKKQTAEFVSNIDLIDCLPPGLYEATFERRDPNAPHDELISGDYITRFEERTLGDIEALGGVDPADEMRFGTVKRVSEANEGLYRSFMQPWVQMWSNETTANVLSETHPQRAQHYFWSDMNPFMKPLKDMAETVRANRKPVSEDNPFLHAEKAMSEQIVNAWNTFRDARDMTSEKLFQTIYDSPVLQSMVGLHAEGATPRPKKVRDEAYEALVEKRKGDLRARIEEGGFVHALMRGLIYTAMAERIVDERAFAMLKRVGDELASGEKMPLAEFKELVKEQDFMLLLDEERALAALPHLVPEMADRRKLLETMQRIMSARGEIDGKRKERLQQVAQALGVEDIERKSLAAPAKKARAPKAAASKEPVPVAKPEGNGARAKP